MIKHVCSSLMHHSCVQTQSYCFVQIVPIENIEGRKAAEEGDTCLRRTFSGVDLNRNWGTEWKQQVCSPTSAIAACLPVCAMSSHSKTASINGVGHAMFCNSSIYIATAAETLSCWLPVPNSLAQMITRCIQPLLCQHLRQPPRRPCTPHVNVLVDLS